MDPFRPIHPDEGIVGWWTEKPGEIWGNMYLGGSLSVVETGISIGREGISERTWDPLLVSPTFIASTAAYLAVFGEPVYSESTK